MSGEAELLQALQHALQQGDPAAALERCEAHLEQHPQDAGGHRHRAQLLAAAQLRLPALRAAMRACELAPDDARCWSDLGRVHARFGEFALAARAFEEAVTIDPGYADGWHNLACAARELGDVKRAFESFKQVLALEPGRAASWLALGSLLMEQGQFDDGVECLERAARHDPALAGARSRLAEHWSRDGKVRRAEVLFRQSVSLEPDHPRGWFGLGRTLEDLGDAAGALDCYLRVLEIAPGHAAALGQYLALVRGPADAALLERTRSALGAAQLGDEGQAAIGYGLAQYHDRHEEPEAAAAAGRIANAARRRSGGPLDRSALQARIDGVLATCTREFFGERRRFGLGSAQPVFIVGLPRSGTTLVEQALAAHPRLHGAGELADLPRLATQCVGPEDELWQAACRLDLEASRRVAGEYLRCLRQGAVGEPLRISDKSPLNFFHLGFAALLFPYARVVHCRRDPRDTALSIWLQNFNAEQRYATDFGDLACFHAEHLRLMRHWRAHLPLPILELHYEEMVGDLETQARRLLEFLDVPWDPACLDFHRSTRAVQTPSRWQVRQPLYTRSVGRWRAYAPWLPELPEAFAQAEAPGVGWRAW